VTYMTFWMSRQGRQMKGHLESGVRASLAEGGRWGLFTLVFLAVIREGIETGLFLSAATFASSGTETLVGGIAGLVVAVAIAIAIYAGGVRLNMGRFFQIAGLLLVVFGAAMLRYSVHEFEEVGLIPPMIERVWYTGRELPEGTGLGAVLQGLVGYTSKPSLSQLIAFTGYYLIIGLALWRPWRRTPSTGTVTQTTAA
jgi:high-affinity iron transporter